MNRRVGYLFMMSGIFTPEFQGHIAPQRGKIPGLEHEHLSIAGMGCPPGGAMKPRL
jgi:hypothetical protein